MMDMSTSCSTAACRPLRSEAIRQTNLGAGSRSLLRGDTNANAGGRRWRRWSFRVRAESTFTSLGLSSEESSGAKAKANQVDAKSTLRFVPSSTARVRHHSRPRRHTSFHSPATAHKTLLPRYRTRCQPLENLQTLTSSHASLRQREPF